MSNLNVSKLDKSKKNKSDEVITKSQTDPFYTFIKKYYEPPNQSIQKRGGDLGYYDAILDDPVAYSLLESRVQAISKAKWNIIIEEKNKKITSFVKNSLQMLNFDSIKGEILRGIFYGFYIQEIMWIERNNKVVIDRLISRHPKYFILKNNHLRLLNIKHLHKGSSLKQYKNKFIIFTYDNQSTLDKAGVAQKLFWPTFFKKHIIKFWTRELEKSVHPTTLVEYPDNTEEHQRASLLNAAENIQSQSAIRVPQGIDLKFLEKKQLGSLEFKNAIEFFNNEIRHVFGTSDQQTQFQCDAKAITSCYNNTIIKWLVDYNYGPQKSYPKMVIDTIKG